MRAVPDMSPVDVAFGNIGHLPRWSEIPATFREERGPFCQAVQRWFFSGAKREGQRLIVGTHAFIAKEGVKASKAVMALQAVLVSFEPKHEHKIAGCGFLLSEWFDLEAAP